MARDDGRRRASRRRARACRRGRGRARVGDDGGDDEREAGFGMTRTRVTHTCVAGGRDGMVDGACRRDIEAMRAHVPPPPQPPPRPPRACVGEDGGDDEREAGCAQGVRDDARAIDTWARHRRAMTRVMTRVVA